MPLSAAAVEEIVKRQNLFFCALASYEEELQVPAKVFPERLYPTTRLEKTATDGLFLLCEGFCS